MGLSCSTYGGEERLIQGFGGDMRERDHLGDPDVDGRIILRYLQEVGCGGMDWIELVQDRDRWRALVNVAMNLGVP
jgi:hypothetical protein